MKKKKNDEPLYKDIGLRLQAIRKTIKMTAGALSEETGISRSYISGFERGYRLPTSKYLKHLFERHNANLNYIFGVDGRKIRTTEDEIPPNFGSLQQEIDYLLVMMAKVPPFMYAVLGFASVYESDNRHLINQFLGMKGE